MSMAQMYPAATLGVIALTIGGLAVTMITGMRWRSHGPWRAAHLTAAALYASALIITVVLSTEVGWSALQYAAVGVFTLATAIAVWAALLGRGGTVPPRRREPLPDEGGQVIAFPVRRPYASDEVA